MTQANNVGQLTPQVNSSGVLQVAGGGTGAATLTANNVLLGNGTSAFQAVAPGTSGNVLTSNGTTWTSAAAGGGFASGTVMLFAQTSAPTGWTKLTNLDNYALRVVSGTASTGGSVAFTTAFASQAVSGTVGTSGATTLSTAQIASHSHSTGIGSSSASCGSTPYAVNNSSNGNLSTSSAGGGGSHTHTGGTFTGTAINLAVQYVDVIRASKD